MPVGPHPTFKPPTEAQPRRDKIVYIVTTKPGGIDGRDHTDKGGTIMWASFDKAEMEAKITNLGGWYTLTPTVIDVKAAITAVYAKLDPLEKLLLRTLCL